MADQSTRLQKFVYSLSNMGMDKSTGVNPVNDIKIRGRSSCIEKNLSRDTSISSTCSSVIYHERVTMNNGMCYSARMWTDFKVRVSRQE